MSILRQMQYLRAKIYACLCLREHILDSILKAAAHGLFAYVSLYCKTQQNKNKLAGQDKGPALTAALSDVFFCSSALWRQKMIKTENGKERHRKKERPLEIKAL